MVWTKVKLDPAKPAVKAKSTRRGRPLGSKNKPKNPIDDFKKTLDEWDRMENQVNWEEIAKKQEQSLNIYKIENEELAKICKRRWEEIEHLKYLITYLERRLEDASI